MPFDRPTRLLLLLSGCTPASDTDVGDTSDASGAGASSTGERTTGSVDETTAPGVTTSASTTATDGASTGELPPPPDFDPNPTLGAIAAGTALDLGPFTCDQPADNPSGCAAITDYSGFVYDPYFHRMLMFGGGHAGGYQSSVQVFDFAALTWSEMMASTTCEAMVPSNFDGEHAAWIDTGQPLARHVWDMLAVGASDAGRQLTILTSGGLSPESCNPDPGEFGPIQPRISRLDLDTSTWSWSAIRPDDEWYYATAAEYDPVSSTYVVFGEHGIKRYDPVTDEVTLLSAQGVPGHYSDNLVYFPPTDRFYYITRGPAEVWELAIDRDDPLTSTAELIAVGGDVPTTEETGWGYDSHAQILGGGITAGVFQAFDPATRQFSAHPITPDSSEGATIDVVVFHALAFDPVDGVFIVIAAEPGGGGHRTWAYRFG